MRKALSVALIWLSCAMAQGQAIKYANTIKINPGDSPERIIEKAAHVVPTANQMSSLENEFIAFVHIGPNTFTRKEWGTGHEDPSIFGLQTLDTDQWCQAIKDAGMKMVILTVKHHDGFVLWQSRYTRHGIMSTGFKGGKGDILRSLSASCRKYGLKLGVYLSPADLYQIENPQGFYGNLSKYTLRTIPRPVSGRPFADKRRFKLQADDYNEYFLNQLYEILTEYGPIHEVWFDGAHPKRKGGQQYNYTAWKKLIRTLAPHASIFGREDIRWCGNEAGRTRDTEWNVIPYAQNPDTAAHFADLTAADLGSRDVISKGGYLHYQQAETDVSIRDGWFYRDDSRQKVRSADDVFDIYERSVGGNATFLLNIPPNREGRFSDRDVAVLREVGRRIKETYGTDLLKGADGPGQVLDDNKNTYLVIDSQKPWIEIKLKQKSTFNRLLIQEAIAQRGERVEEHAVEVMTDNGWKEVAHATNIGYKRILRFPEVTSDRIRVRILKSRLMPAISKISLHHYQGNPPQVTATRSPEGMVTLSLLSATEGFKPNQSATSVDTTQRYAIHYTTDDTAPTAQSPTYDKPFRLENGVLRAICIGRNKSGAEYNERWGYLKSDWKVTTSCGQDSLHTTSMAIDGDPQTYWLAAGKGGEDAMVIDLGKVLTVNGFAYTPPTDTEQGLLEKGMVLLSEDGVQWKETPTFEFGNLINDPVRRFHYLKSPIQARYLKIRVLGTARNSPYVSIADWDVF